MKIAYIIRPHSVLAGRFDGIRSQAVTWGSALVDKGHQVDYIDNWGNYDWSSYDVVHFFGSGSWVNTIRIHLSKMNDKFVYSPIYDPNPFLESKSQHIQKKISKLTRGKWNCALYDVCREYKGYRKILVRSEYESDMIQRLFDVSKNNIVKVPLSYSHILNYEYNLPMKENFVFHMSLFTQPRKNVIRLVKAAQKYGFKLKIAGYPGTEDAYKEFMDVVNNAPNIKILGFVSEEEKKDLYRRAKVFALPSINEGVGIVAVDAALYGDDIVVTNIGGPKEYYNGMAEIVNPYSVDEIGQACIRLLNGKTYQPELRKYIRENYSLDVIADKLISVYKTL